MAEISGQRIETTVKFDEEDLEIGIPLDVFASRGLSVCHSICLSERRGPNPTEVDECPAVATVSGTEVTLSCDGLENGCDTEIIGGWGRTKSPIKIAAEYIVNLVAEIKKVIQDSELDDKKVTLSRKYNVSRVKPSMSYEMRANLPRK